MKKITQMKTIIKSIEVQTRVQINHSWTGWMNSTKFPDTDQGLIDARALARERESQSGMLSSIHPFVAPDIIPPTQARIMRVVKTQIE